MTVQRGRAECFEAAGGCWGEGLLTPHDCWVNGREAAGGGGGAVAGDAAPAAGGASQRGREGLLLQ